MRASFHESLSAEDRTALEPLLRGQAPPGSEEVVGRILRRVLRLRLPSGRLVYAKQHLFPFRRVRLRYALRATPSARERAALLTARARGLRVPTPLAEFSQRGLLGPRLAVLVSEALPPGDEASFEQALVAVDELLEAGVFHPDLHRENLRMIEGVIYTLDYQSVRFAGRWSWIRQGSQRSQRAQRSQMLAKFAASLPVDSLAASFEDSLSGEPALFREAFSRQLGRLQRTTVAAHRRHRLRSSTRVVRERCGIFGTRLRLRDCEARLFAPERFCAETPSADPRLGRLMRASSKDGRIERLRRRAAPFRGGLRELWARAGGDTEAKDLGFLAWETTGPWPFATQSLYILSP